MSETLKKYRRNNKSRKTTNKNKGGNIEETQTKGRFFGNTKNFKIVPDNLSKSKILDEDYSEDDIIFIIDVSGNLKKIYNKGYKFTVDKPLKDLTSSTYDFSMIGSKEISNIPQITTENTQTETQQPENPQVDNIPETETTQVDNTLPENPLPETTQVNNVPESETPLPETPQVNNVPESETPLPETPLPETTQVNNVPESETQLSETPLSETPLPETTQVENPLSETPLSETPLSETPLPETTQVDNDKQDVNVPPINSPPEKNFKGLFDKLTGGKVKKTNKRKSQKSRKTRKSNKK